MIAAATPGPDGLVHMLKNVSAERGTRTIEVKCGYKMPKFRTFEQLAGATGFHSRVTCQQCLDAYPQTG